MNDFLIIRLLESRTIIYPKSFCLGSVEIRPAKLDTPDERKYLEESLEKNNEKIDLEYGMRLVCIIKDAKDLEEAQAISQPVFEEVLDVMSLDSLGIASFSLMKSGVARNLSSGKVYPTTKYEVTPTNLYKIEDDRYPETSQKEYILANRNRIEICGRLLKSLHWSRHATWEKNLQMRILFNWFSIESLLKLDQNDNVAPKAMLAMGFPIGQKKNEVPVSIMQELENHPEYTSWKRLITNDMDKIREYRNNSVHLGFRPWDLSESELKKYSFLTEIARNSSQKLAQYAISSGCKNALDLWSEAPKLLDKIDNLAGFVHGTVIYSLANQTYKWY